MYAPTPSYIQVHEYRRQDMIDVAARYRLLTSALHANTPATAKIATPRFIRAFCQARDILASLTFAAFGPSAN
jgi:hypothetical protein